MNRPKKSSRKYGLPKTIKTRPTAFARPSRSGVRRTGLGEGAMAPVSNLKVANYTQAQVEKLLDDYYTKRSEEALMAISESLFIKNSQYKRLITFFSNVLPFPYIITPNQEIPEGKKEKVRKEYNNLGTFLNSMKIKHNFKLIMFNVMTYGVFYGYVYHDPNSFVIQKFSPAICKATSIEDGAYNFSIDMTYFEKNVKLLENYPDEVTKKFNSWITERKTDRSLSNWVELDSTSTICIKANHLTQNAIPPFAGTFDSVFSIYGYKKLAKYKDELNNYKVLVQKIPLRDKTGVNNDFMVDMDMSDYFHEQVAEASPDNVAVITTPMEIDTINFEKDSLDSDGIAKATKEFWEESGTSQALFSSSMTETSEGIKKSTETDEQLVYEILTGFDTWLKRYVKLNSNAKFLQPKLLDISKFNEDKESEVYLKGAQAGMPFKTHFASAKGLEPIEMLGLAMIENEIFELPDKLIPLRSSHTETSTGETGRPTNEDVGKDDADETSRGRDKKGSTSS